VTKRVRAMKRAMALATRVKCDKESDGFGGKSNGNEGVMRLTVTRAMATVMRVGEDDSVGRKALCAALGGNFCLRRLWSVIVVMVIVDR